MAPRPLLSLLLFLLFFFPQLPLLGRDREFIGVGRADGPALLNEIVFENEANLYAGDWIETGPETSFLVLASQKERSVLAPNSVAQLRKDGDTTIVALESGSVAVSSHGSTRVILETLGIQVRPLGHPSSLAQVSALTPRQVRVSAIRGAVEFSAGTQPSVLDPGQTAMISDTMDQKLGDIYGLASSQKNHLSVRIQRVAGDSRGLVSVVKRHRKYRSPRKPHDKDDDD